MRPLVFVHGFLGGSAQWQHQASIADTGRALVQVDLPGFGKNAHLPAIDRIADFAAWVLEHLSQRGVKDFDLLGHSMGGMIVQDMVHQAPQRVHALILYGTGPVGVMPGRFESIEASMERARQDGPQATARRIAATWFLNREHDPEYPACAAIAETASLDAILAGLAAMRDWSGEAHLPSIKAKTLVLWGDRDRTYLWPQPEQLWRNIPAASLAVLPHCAHAVHLERPALFNTLVRDFLDR